jgi:deltex-like protein
MPSGTMTVAYSPDSRLEGGTITITYMFPGGTQDERHPHPGARFSGTHRVAYLPGTSKGFEALGMLQQAWDQQLLFRVGTSITTGLSNTVIWNDIHHKTSIQGGPTSYGYPDPTYLDRLMDELASSGIRPHPKYTQRTAITMALA